MAILNLLPAYCGTKQLSSMLRMRESMPVSTPGAHILASKSHSVEKEPGLLGNVADARTWAMGVEYEAAPPSCAQKQGSAQK